MEGLKKRAYLLGAVLVIFGVAMVVTPQASRTERTERWMEDNALSEFDGWHMQPSASNPKQSYRMNEATYNTLRPFGIVSRVFVKGDKRYDVVLIASNRRESFHDPRICFTGQFFTIKEERVIDIPTKTRGVVKANYVNMDSPSGPTTALYFYRGPDGFAPTTRGLKVNIVMSLLKGSQDADGVFYRIIPGDGATTKEEITAFAADYLDNSNSYSHGYF